jgi:hypothetical protein
MMASWSETGHVRPGCSGSSAHSRGVAHLHACMRAPGGGMHGLACLFSRPGTRCRWRRHGRELGSFNGGHGNVRRTTENSPRRFSSTGMARWRREAGRGGWRPPARVRQCLVKNGEQKRKRKRRWHLLHLDAELGSGSLAAKWQTALKVVTALLCSSTRSKKRS